jgi:hypothetical protein
MNSAVTEYYDIEKRSTVSSCELRADCLTSSSTHSDIQKEVSNEKATALPRETGLIWKSVTSVGNAGGKVEQRVLLRQVIEILNVQTTNE